MLIDIKGHRVEIDDGDLKIVRQRDWQTQMQGKIRVFIYRKSDPSLFLHRLLANAKKDQVVTFKNGNGLDCRKANLEIRNRGALAAKSAATTSASGHRGVTYDKSRGDYKAHIGGVTIGRYATAIGAARAYYQEFIKQFGSDTGVEFPPEVAGQ